MASKGLEELRNILKEDRSKGYPKYPDQAIFALKSKQVTEAIEKKLNESALTDIRSLGYNHTTGLNNIVFDFAPTAAVRLSSASLLVIMDGSCKVVGFVDPFDSNQPNPYRPPIAEEKEISFEGDLPFVLARPTSNVPLTQEQEEAFQHRFRAFWTGLQQRRPTLDEVDEGPPCLPGAVKTYCWRIVTTCPPYFGPCGPDNEKFGCDCDKL